MRPYEQAREAYLTTTIQISIELKNFLVAQAIKKGETYDQILRRLLSKIWGVKLEKE